MKKLTFAFIGILLTAILSLSVLAAESVNLTLVYDGEEHSYSAEEIVIKLNEETITDFDMEPIILEGRTLIPARNVFENMSCVVDWSAETKEVNVKRGTDEITLKINSDTGYKNGVEFKMDVPAKIINDYTMLPIRAVSEAMGCSVFWDNYNRTVVITDNYVIDAEILSTTEAATETTTIVKETIVQPVADKKQDGIKLLWNQMSTVDGNLNEMKKGSIDGLNIISPTWFYIANSEGDVVSKASHEYADWARDNGYQVWALITNSFDPAITHHTLSDDVKRKKVINQILEYVDEYELEGLNIDFESVAVADGEYYVQFIREITPLLKERGVIVSVDMYVPSKWSVHYNMEEVGKIVDYVMIMAYDEHWGASPVSGSVSSMPWAETAMKAACEMVDKDKLFMGVPFYTRVWAEETQTDGTVKVSSRALGMDDAYEELTRNNANIVWDEECGQYYGEFVKEGILYKCWIEDERSMEERLKIARKYDVKGVAAWKRGFERDSIWELINRYY